VRPATWPLSLCQSGELTREILEAMSHENLETFKRGLDAYNRRDIDALLEELDPEVEWHPALAALLGGGQTVFRGHEGVRESIREEDDALALYQPEVSEIRDLGTTVLAIGCIRARGREIESPFFILTEGLTTRIAEPPPCDTAVE
jgi:ketosteroid isomerase-like protein